MSKLSSAHYAATSIIVRAIQFHGIPQDTADPDLMQAWSEFVEFCESNRSAASYLELRDGTDLFIIYPKDYVIPLDPTDWVYVSGSGRLNVLDDAAFNEFFHQIAETEVAGAGDGAPEPGDTRVPALAKTRLLFRPESGKYETMLRGNERPEGLIDVTGYAEHHEAAEAQGITIPFEFESDAN